MPIEDDNTVECNAIREPEAPLIAEFFSENSIDMAALTLRRRVRQKNEDQYSLVRRQRTGIVLASTITEGRLLTDEDIAWLRTVWVVMRPAKWPVNRQFARFLVLPVGKAVG